MAPTIGKKQALLLKRIITEDLADIAWATVQVPEDAADAVFEDAAQFPSAAQFPTYAIQFNAGPREYTLLLDQFGESQLVYRDRIANRLAEIFGLGDIDDLPGADNGQIGLGAYGPKLYLVAQRKYQEKTGGATPVDTHRMADDLERVVIQNTLRG